MILHICKRIVIVVGYILFLLVLIEGATTIFLLVGLSRYIDTMPEQYKSRVHALCVRNFYSRLFQKDEYQFDTYCYRVPKKGKYFRGLNGRYAYPIQRVEKDEIRILCLGTSTTYGLGVAHEDSWPYRLELMLRKAYPNQHIVVLNAGQPGAIYRQVKRLYQFYLAPYAADIILYKMPPVCSDNLEVPKGIALYREVLWRCLDSLRFFHVVSTLLDIKRNVYIEDRTEKRPTRLYVYDAIMGIKESDDNAVWDVKSDFESIQTISRAYGEAVVIGIENIAKEKNKTLFSDYKNVDVAALGIDRVVWMYDTFEDACQQHDVEAYFIDQMHLTEKGTEIVATSVYNYLIENRYIDEIITKRKHKEA